MLKGIVESSIRFRGVVVVLASVVLVYGLFTATHAKFDVFPEFAPPQVVIQTEAPGLSPEQVEALVTRPIESAVNGAVDLESIRSQSIQGLSIVTTVFREGTDVLKSRQMVGERLVDAARRLPRGLGAPTMTPMTSSTSTVLVVGLTSDQRSPMALRTFADWTLRPQLLSVPGVAKVVIYGGQVRQMQIQIRPDRLIAYGLGIDDVMSAARQATAVRGAGFIDTGPQRIVLHTKGQALSPHALGETVVAWHAGVAIRLHDVAYVMNAPEPKFGDSAILGKPGVVLVVSSQFGGNTLQVTEAVEHALDELKPACESEQIALHPSLFRPATFVETAIANMRTSLLIGGGLVALVLFLFLMDFRTVFISLTAIPLSLLVAVIILDYVGATLNTMTLGGLVIAIGEVVDDAIIDVENILRRLRINALSPTPRSPFRVVLDASLEVRGAVVYATLIVVLVFVPVLTMSGLEGRFFAPLGLAYIFAILASLAVALTVTPALSFLLLTRGHAQQGNDPALARFLKTRYHNLLKTMTARPKLIFASVFLLCAAGVAALPFFGGQFLPEFREGSFILHMSAAPGTSIQESLRLGRQVSATLLENPNIRSVTQRVGRAEQGDDIFGSHYSEFDVGLRPLSGEQAEAMGTEIREALVGFPGVYFAVNSFLTERVEETLTGITAELAIKIFGDDLDVLDEKARQIAHVVSGIHGAADVQVLSPPGTPRMTVQLRRDRLGQFDLQPVEVLEAIQTAYQGTIVGQTYQRNQVFSVVAILNPEDRRDPERIGALLLRNKRGALVPLSQVAYIEPTTGPYAVLHEGTRRFQAVTCNVHGRDVASFANDVEQTVRQNVVLPVGMYSLFTGTAQARSRSQQQILLHSAGVAVGIVLLLFIVLRNLHNLLLVLLNLPFALVGGVFAVFATGGWLSMGSLVGFVTLFGITTRNSIMMVSHYEHLVGQERMTWNLETALRGASDRLVPIAMTALTTGLGLLPLAIGSGDPGREIEGPMAIVILGGLATSTILNLLVLPTFALSFGRFGIQHAGD